MRCLVTGASGFLGSWLARQLLSEGHDVLAVVRAGGNHPRLEAIASKVNFVYADLSTIGGLSTAVSEFAPDQVFHLAWWGGNSNRYVNDPEQIYANIPGSLELIRIAHQSGCSAFFFFGSSVEYGSYQVPVREVDEVAPRNLYGCSKFATMQLMSALSENWGMRFCGIRPFWTYGPMDDEKRLIPQVIMELIARRRPRLTEGRQLWDFLYVEDAVKAVSQLAFGSQASGIFNLGSGQAVPLREVASLIGNMIDPALEIGFGDIPYGPSQIMHLQADISKLQSVTGWRPETSLEHGLRRTIDWFLSNSTTIYH